MSVSPWIVHALLLFVILFRTCRQQTAPTGLCSKAPHLVIRGVTGAFETIPKTGPCITQGLCKTVTILSLGAINACGFSAELTQGVFSGVHNLIYQR